MRLGDIMCGLGNIMCGLGDIMCGLGDIMCGLEDTMCCLGDTMCCFDCELMPKLQHIRVAGAHFADFTIPTELAALWR